MPRRRKRPTRRPNAKFYIFLGTIAAVVIVVVFFITNVNTYTIEQGEIGYEGVFPVVVVRDEQVIQAESYGKANFLVEEGARVEADKPVAEVYTWGYQANVLQELTIRQTSIAEYQENKLLTEGTDSQLGVLNDGIVEKAKEIKSIVSSGDGDLIATEQELKELMTQKRDYLNETVRKDRALEGFYSEEQMLKERIDNWRQEERAPQTGVVSFYFDGAEQVLNAERLQEISSADINTILNGTAQQQETSSGGDSTAAVEQPLYRLVNHFKWYLLVEFPQPMIEFAKNTTYQISFDQYPARTYEGNVVGIITEETSNIYVVEILDDIGELLSVRRTDANMQTMFEGMKVPEEAIVIEEGVQGVYVIREKERTFVPVSVKIIKDGYAIIESANEGAPIGVGDEVKI